MLEFFSGVPSLITLDRLSLTSARKDASRLARIPVR